MVSRVQHSALHITSCYVDSREADIIAPRFDDSPEEVERRRLAALDNGYDGSALEIANSSDNHSPGLYGEISDDRHMLPASHSSLCALRRLHELGARKSSGVAIPIDRHTSKALRDLGRYVSAQTQSSEPARARGDYVDYIVTLKDPITGENVETVVRPHLMFDQDTENAGWTIRWEKVESKQGRTFFRGLKDLVQLSKKPISKDGSQSTGKLTSC
jgi:hypothetical protein